jgi:GT2 family glycosyltransferase
VRPPAPSGPLCLIASVIFSISKEQKHIKAFEKVFSYFKVKFVIMDANKGHLTRMWNQLFKIAYDEGCDYFYQCGDDIQFHTKGWVNDCIKILQAHNNIGLTGPFNNNSRILTQSFVSRKHFDLFGYYFPEEIINWYCDDWINEVYRGINSFYPLYNHLCVNIGGKPRYNINNDPNIQLHWNNGVKNMRNICTIIVNRDLIRSKHLINKLY